MAKSLSFWKKRFQSWLITKFIILLIRITGSTTRIQSLNQQVLQDTLKEYGSVIVATWHQNIYFSIWLLRKQELTALISSSDDGEVINDVFTHFGYQAVRGSTSRGGIPALKQMIKLLKGKTSVAITPDGPLGPAKKIQSGVVLLAKYSGVPIIPWHYQANHQWRLNSWDRHKIPKPFTTIVEAFGEPFHVAKELMSEDVPAVCEKLETSLKELANKTAANTTNS
ncbi:MAG: lysophospholipid acyltransferase family protein [SAR324 cluster bacterium]|nr:lysophospholipid acyltransferase family protein [SAR324 cluster bacterium]MBL7034372.1 lysophospholipid acyltransferase family protein [SAR324 cluster bacterium]